MRQYDAFYGRRRFLQSLAVGITAISNPGLFAQRLSETAASGEGPFYPDRLPLDTDNDLLILNDAAMPGVGEVTHLSGRVRSVSGQPLRNAFVEIWQADSTGSYIHTGGRQPTGNDTNFQGYGRFLTDAEGRYYFRTIKPIAYTLQGVFRCPHIHLGISTNGRRIFTSEVLVAGHPANAQDNILGRMNEMDLQTLLVDFTPIAGSQLGELNANFDVVLGQTAYEDDDGQLRGVGAPLSRRSG